MRRWLIEIVIHALHMSVHYNIQFMRSTDNSK
jgi:hypothetical protein